MLTTVKNVPNTSICTICEKDVMTSGDVVESACGKQLHKTCFDQNNEMCVDISKRSCAICESEHSKSASASIDDTKSSSDSYDDPLLNACRNGDLDQIKSQYAKDKSTINGRFLNGIINEKTSLLDCAAFNGHFEVVKFLVDHGADVNSTRQDGTPPLTLAVQNKHNDVVKYLLDRGADPEKCGKDNLTPLYSASSFGNEEAVQWLLKKQVKVDFKFTQNGAAPLHMAAQKGHLGIVKKLVEAKANIDIGVSIINNKKDHMEEIRNQFMENTTPLMLAARSGHEEIVNYLIAQGANVSAEDTVGRTAYTRAFNTNHSNIKKILTQAGAAKIEEGAVLSSVRETLEGLIDLFKAPPN